jgi:hypothetical protein
MLPTLAKDSGVHLLDTSRLNPFALTSMFGGDVLNQHTDLLDDPEKI